MAKWIRETTVTVSDQVFPYQGYEIHFDVSFDDTEDPDQAKVKIYNLTPDTENNIEVGDDIIIESGYQGDTGTLLEGIITDVHGEADGTERICEIEATDSSNECLNKQITKTFAPGTMGNEIAEFAISEAGLEMREMRLKDNVEYKRGYTADGKVREVMKDVVINDCKSKCQVVDKGVYCLDWKDSIDDAGIVINQDTGMVGIPTRISGDHVVRSYEVKCLLEYRLRAGMVVTVQSETANGLYLVKKGKHKSDRGEHLTIIEVEDFSGSGPGGKPIEGGGDKDRLPDLYDMWKALF